MESERDEASQQHPKRSKPTSNGPFSSASNQESSFKSLDVAADLINKILLKIPVKSLVRFSCVEKSWLGLICSPEFVKTHLSISAKNKDYTRQRVMLCFDQPEYSIKDCSVNSLLYDHATRAIDLFYPPNISHQSVTVLGSVNGLICLAIEEKDLFIWNPSIRKLKKLPSSGTGCFFLYGFGYDELHDDYKVVSVTHNACDDNLHYDEGKIYSLNNNSWRRLDDFQSGIQLMNGGVFVNGKLHWAITTKHYHYYNSWDIIFVDLADGRWGEMEKPCYGEEAYDVISFLSVLGNDLSMLCNHLGSHADVWVMKEYGVIKSWTKMFIIKSPYDLVGDRLSSPPFCISSEGEIMFMIGSVFMIYNPKDDSMRIPNVTNCDHLVEAKLYIESLVWPFVAEGTRNATTSEAAKAQFKTIV